MSLPATFKQAVFLAKGEPLTVREVPMITPEKGEVLVKTEACGVCFSDVYAQNGSTFPLVPGHEIIGRVVALGEGVTSWKIGDRIGGAWHGGHDGTCHACKKGYFQMCDTRAVNGISRNGGYAEYCTLRSEAGVPIPSSITASKYAPILCAGVTMFNSLRRQKLTPGSTVAVQGLGGLGHLAIQYANKFGYRVVALSRGADKEKFARELGAHEYVDTSKVNAGDALKELGYASVVMTTSPDGKGVPDLLRGLGPDGKLLILSVPGDITVNTGVMLAYGLSIQSWPSGHAKDSEEAVKFTELAGIDCLIEEFPIERVNDAYNAMLNGSVRFRSVITFE
ncbi:chaperonin 10-like protein [Immersiella caudata]|uniref:Chaperonin 10-like protein n=1 Tax=Immersiella caudata TaxID=314043 RepID=A0AA39WJF1_9PEZI|nr:chaperonin 10-like protein [Immersiella caudata]